MTFWVWYTTGRHDPMLLEKFEYEDEVVTFLNRYAGNEEFRFTVVEGSEATFKPVQVATKFVRES